MTAVFIVMIAIFGFAALAFYFSTYKADTNDCEFPITEGII